MNKNKIESFFVVFFDTKIGHVIEYSIGLTINHPNIEMLVLGNNFQKVKWNVIICQLNNKEIENKRNQQEEEEEKEKEREEMNLSSQISSTISLNSKNKSENKNLITNKDSCSAPAHPSPPSSPSLWCCSVFHCLNTNDSNERYSRMRSIGIISTSLSECYQMISLLKYLIYQVNSLNGNLSYIKEISNLLFTSKLSTIEVFHHFFTQYSSFLDEFNQLFPSIHPSSSLLPSPSSSYSSSLLQPSSSPLTSSSSSLPFYHYYLSDSTPSHLMLLSHYLLFPCRILLYSTCHSHFLCEFALQLLHSIDA